MLTKEQSKMIEENEKLIQKFVHKTFPNESWDVKQDLISEGKTIIYDRINTFDPTKGAYSTWLFSVLGFCLRNYHTKEKYDNSMIIRIKNHMNDECEDDDSVSNAERHLLIKSEQYKKHIPTDLENMIDIQKLEEKINQLDDVEKKVIIMFMSDYSPLEISEVCGITQNQLYYVKDKVIQKLRLMMKKK